MTFQLSTEVEHFVQSLVQSGRFPDETAVVTAAMRLLREREDLAREIQIGIDELDRGEGIPGEVVFQRLEARAAEIARGAQ